MKSESNAVCKRNSRLELIRIICIFFIVLRHYGTQADWGIDGFTVANWTWQVLFIQLIKCLGSAANNIFLLITGYFMINREINWKRIVTLIAEMFFYSWIIAASIYGTKTLQFSIKEPIKALFPIWFGYNWYICCYTVFCCFLPFINQIIRRATREQYKRFLIVAIFLSCIARVFKATVYLGDQFSVDHFLIVYAIGAYIKLFGIPKKTISWRTGFFVSAGAIIFSVAGFSIIGKVLKMDKLVLYANYFDPAWTITGVAVAFFLFMWIITSKPIYNRKINAISKSVIGVFIIHHNPLLKGILWNKISPNANYINSTFLPIHCLIKVTIVCLLCIIIDQIRLATVNKIFLKLLGRYGEKGYSFIKKVYSIVEDKIPLA